MAKPIRWSFSRIDKYARCPRAYKVSYLDRNRGSGNDNMRFGTWLHNVLEAMHKRAIDDEHVGEWDQNQALELARREFGKAGLSEIDHMSEGLDILDRWIAAHPRVDCYNVLAVESRFEIEIAGYQVMGYIDRIDRLPNGWIKVVDYKTNRALYRDEDLNSNLQLSIYAMAAKALFPWAKGVELEFDMLRHTCIQQTHRSAKDLELASQYVQTMVEAALSDREFAPKLHRLCGWCDHRRTCGAYQKALQDGAIEGQDTEGANMDELAAERERVAAVSKLAADRQKEIDAAIKTWIEMEGDLSAGGRHYEMRTRTTQSYPVADTVEAFAVYMGEDDARDAITVVNNAKVKSLITKLRDELPGPQVAMLRGNLSAITKKRRTQYLSSSEADK